MRSSGNRVLRSIAVATVAGALVGAQAVGAAAGPSGSLAAVAGTAEIVQTIPARELGLAEPTDVVARPEHSAFIVQGLVDDEPTAVAVPADWDVQDPVASVVSAEADEFEARPARDRLSARNPADGLDYRLDPDAEVLEARGRGNQVVATYDLSGLDLSDPSAVAFAPSTDITDDPGVHHVFVADSGSYSWTGGIVEAELTAASGTEHDGPAIQSATTLATTVGASIVQVVNASAWSPPSSDASGIVWDPVVGELLVVDSEINEIAAFQNVNLWRVARNGTVRSTGATIGSGSAGFSDEPTGVGLRTPDRTMFVTDDTGDNSLYVVSPGPDAKLGSTDDVVRTISVDAYASDPEDPAYHPGEGVVYFLSGVDRQIHRIDPVDGVFANGNDVRTSFDISFLGPTDFEGMAIAPNRGTLYLAGRTTEQIFELTTSGTHLRTIDVPDNGSFRFISGLAVAPSSSDPNTPGVYFVDRGVDESLDARMVELSFPSVDDAPATPNATPVAVNDSASTQEDVKVLVDVRANDTDADGDSLAIASFTDPPKGSVREVSGKLEYTPDPNTNGSDSFTYRVSDGRATSNSATVTVQVAAVNDAPVAVNDTASTVRDTSVLVDVRANDTDVEGSALTITNLAQPTSGTTAIESGRVRYTPTAGFTGTDSFTYRVSDGQLSSNTATVTVTVDPPSGTPTAVADTVTTDEDTPVAVDVVANDTDPEDDDLVAVVATQPANGTAVASGGTVTYTPRADFNGSDSFTYQASDGEYLSTAATVTVTVRPVNDAPVARDDSATALHSEARAIDVLANDSDVDNNPLTIVIEAAPASGSVVVGPGGTIVSYTANPGFVGTDSFSYRAFDGTAPSAAATVTIQVSARPVAVADSANTAQGQPVTIDVLVNDVDDDGDTLSVSGVTQSAGGVASVNANGTITFTPNITLTGSTTFTYTVTDGVNVSQPGGVTVTIDDSELMSFAVSESTTLGAISRGTYRDTFAADNVHEVLIEDQTKGKPASRLSRLEHRWTVQVRAGETTSLELEAYRTGTEDNFVFEYSVNGTSFTTLFTVSSGTEARYSASLPNTLAGTIVVRVRDTDRTAGRGATDSLFVDQLLTRTVNPT